MKNSWHIFISDLRKIYTNPVTLIVLGGLIFLPSLYAWFNISAAWDPYSQTDKLPVGVVNEDEGTRIQEQKVDVGQEVIQSLKGNKGMNWQFFEKEEAMEQLKKGKLFAVIVIPENFSARLGTVLEKQPKKATIEYYVNEKINAIAPKITEKGASVIVDQVSKQFIETVNGIIFAFFNDLGVELEKELPDLKKLGTYVFELEAHLPDLHDALQSSLLDANTALKALNRVEEELPTVEMVLGQGRSTIGQIQDLIDQAEIQVKNTLEKVETEISSMDKRIENVEEQFQSIEEAFMHFTEELETLTDLRSDFTDYRTQIDDLSLTLKELLEKEDELQFTEEQVTALEQTLESMEKIAQFLSDREKTLAQIGEELLEKEAQLKDLSQQVLETKETVLKNLHAWKDSFEANVIPTVKEEVSQMKGALDQANTVLVNLQNKLPDVKEMLQRTKGNLQKGEQLLENVLKEYPFIYDKTTQLADNLRKIHEEAQIEDIIELLKNDPEAEKSFLAEPVLLNENKLFPIENYGSGMTPFYTILSLWVGGLLLISLLSTNVMEPEQYLPREIYFGKLFLFLLIGCLQTLIVTLGDLFLLKVQIANPVWFIIFGLLCSMIFMILIYTFVSLFGNVGKAMAIVMLVLQIAGSGGTYPVVLLPKFFQTISPFLPFTYAVGLMREAVGGIVWENVLINTSVLLGIGLLIILLGALLKGLLNKLAEKYLGESEDDGIFH